MDGSFIPYLSCGSSLHNPDSSLEFPFSGNDFSIQAAEHLTWESVWIFFFSLTNLPTPQPNLWVPLVLTLKYISDQLLALSPSPLLLPYMSIGHYPFLYVTIVISRLVSFFFSIFYIVHVPIKEWTFQYLIQISLFPCLRHSNNFSVNLE